MARGGVKLSIYSTFDKKGVDQADKAVKAFTRRFGELNEATKVRTIDGQTEQLVRMSAKLDTAAAKMQKVSDVTGKLGSSLTKNVTVPMVAAAAASIKAATDIDTALTNVRKTVDGTEQQYQALKEAAIEYSKTNAVSAEEVLNAQALGAQLGFAIEELDKFSQVATGLDIATDMDMETASSEMAQFANITKMAHDDIDKYGATIVALGNNLATTESAVSHMGQRTAAAATQVGMSQSQILGWSAAMTSMGINAEAGGTAFSTVIASIDKSVATNSKSLQDWADAAGMSAEEFSQAWGEDASAAFQKLLEGISQSDNVSVTLNQLGINGVRTTDMMKRLSNNTDLVTQALALANDGWSENSALTTEVANRNDSLAAKFEMLANKATAVAEKVGKPLADALLDVMDAAEPLFEAIEGGAEAFAKMDKQSQQTVIQMMAMVAAAGPVLTVVSKITGAASGLTSMAAKLVAKAAASDATIKALTLSLTSAKAGMVGLGLAAAGVVAAIAVSKWQEWQADMERAAQSSLTLTEMVMRVRNAENETASAGEAYLANLGSIAEHTEKLKDLQQDMADSNGAFMESLSSSHVDATTLQGYVDTIDELADKSNLTASEQARLTMAVEGYNEITGSSVTVTDAVNGKLSESTKVINDNAAAWRHNAEMQAYAELYAAKAKELAEAQVGLQQSTKDVAAAQKELDDVIEKANGDYYTYGDQIDEARQKLADAKETQNGYKTAASNATKAMKDVADAQGKANTAYEKSEKRVSKLQSKVEGMGKKSKSAMEKTGTSANTMARKFDEAGIKAKDLAGISDKQFAKMWESCDGDVSKMVKKIQEYNDEKTKDKKSEAKATGNVANGAAKKAIKDYNDTKIKDKTATAKVNITETITKAVKKLQSSSKKSARGGIHKMASGGIATGPTMLNANTLIGEAGTEAFFQSGRTATVVPLSNRQYVRPFAQAVAAEMGGRGASVTINLNYSAGADANQMVRDIAAGLRQINLIGA